VVTGVLLIDTDYILYGSALRMQPQETKSISACIKGLSTLAPTAVLSRFSRVYLVCPLLTVVAMKTALQIHQTAKRYMV